MKSSAFLRETLIIAIEKAAALETDFEKNIEQLKETTALSIKIFNLYKAAQG